MIRVFTVVILFIIISCQSNAQLTKKGEKENTNMRKKVIKTEAEWLKELTDQEYYVLRKKGTDRPSEDGYTNHFEKGTYVCRACKTPLFPSKTKYKSHCGWPSFDDAIEGTIIKHRDISHGMIRTEIVCATCDGHLGHIFDDGPKETTGKRYCVNTSSIEFVKE